MALPGERLILATTLDEVQEGKLFDTMPVHMPLVRWSNISAGRRDRVAFGLNNIFSDQYLFQDVRGGARDTYQRDGEKVRVRLMDLNEKELQFRDTAHSLIKSLGLFDPEDAYAEARSFYTGKDKTKKFEAYVTDTPERQIGRLESVSFRTVALFALHADDPMHIHRVLNSYLLADSEDEVA